MCSAEVLTLRGGTVCPRPPAVLRVDTSISLTVPVLEASDGSELSVKVHLDVTAVACVSSLSSLKRRPGRE